MRGVQKYFCYVILYIFLHSLYHLSLPPFLSLSTLSLPPLSFSTPFTPILLLYTFSLHPFLHISLHSPSTPFILTPHHISTPLFILDSSLYPLSTLYTSLHPLLSTHLPLSSFLDLVRDFSSFNSLLQNPSLSPWKVTMRWRKPRHHRGREVGEGRGVVPGRRWRKVSMGFWFYTFLSLHFWCFGKYYLAYVIMLLSDLSIGLLPVASDSHH